MKRWWFIVSLLACVLCAHAEKRALLIGIGAYPDVDYGWPSIHGDNDIAFAKSMLLTNGFKTAKIDTHRNEQATYQAINKAFQTLIATAQNGDLVYVHFSGHGQQITDLDGDEEDGYDETWVAYDALMESTPTYHGEHHITDDQLNGWLQQLHKKVGAGGQIIVVSDACHSGTSTRDLNEPAEVRGSHSKFVLDGNKSVFRQSRSVDWVSISACADNECNRQHRLADGRQCGSLTYALYLLRNELGTMPLEQLSERLKETISSLVSRPQTPQVEYTQAGNMPLMK